MFIFSMRASTVKFTAVLAAGILAVLGFVIFFPDLTESEPGTAERGSVSIRLDGIENAEDAAAVLERAGYRAQTPPITDKKVTIPERFTGNFPEYAKLQADQGFDFGALEGKEVRKMTFTVTEKDGGAPMIATVFVYRGVIAGGDISSGEPGGAVYPIIRTEAPGGSVPQGQEQEGGEAQEQSAR